MRNVHLELLAVVTLVLTCWGAIDQLDHSGSPPHVVMAAVKPDGKVDVLADFVLTLFLVTGSASLAYVYYSAKWIKDKLFRLEDMQYRFHFLTGAFLLGVALGLVATKTMIHDLDRTWAFTCGAGGALTSWGAYDLIMVALRKKAEGMFGGSGGNGP